jgi:hypothetical protein
MKIWVAPAIILLSIQSAAAQESAGSIKSGHPRIAFTEQDEARIRKEMQSDSLLQRLVQRNNQLSDRSIGSPTTKREIIASRMLDQSRIAVERITQHAMAYRMTGDKKYSNRAIKEMLAAAGFSDWNPGHFLDIGEMLAAMGIGYDWLFDAMTAQQRQTIRRAIMDKGIKIAIRQQNIKTQLWMTGESNWTEVVNSGLIVAALAIADEEPDAIAVINRGIEAFRRTAQIYAPDGATHEGPLYWHYGLTYHALANRALLTATGKPLLDNQAYSKTGNFPIYLQGTTGAWFNFADGRSTFYLSPAMFELSRYYNKPFYAWWTRQQLDTLIGTKFRAYNTEYRFFPFFIAWYDSRGSGGDAPLDMKFGGNVQLVAMRGSWTDGRASFVGAKGGDNSLSHAHQDVGSFVFDTLGHRFATDLGPDNYNLAGYWDNKEGGKRWDIFRLSSTSHNTITIGNNNQRVFGLNVITRSNFTSKDPFAIFDMSKAYAGQAAEIKRGIKLMGRASLLVQDEINRANNKIRWTMMTAANIRNNGNIAVLTISGSEVTAKILSPGNAKFIVLTADPNRPGQDHNVGVKRLAIDLPAGSPRIAVLLAPKGKSTSVAVTALNSWR